MAQAGFLAVRERDLESQEPQTDLDYSDVVEELRKTFKTGKTKNVEWRRQQLLQLYKMYMENFDLIAKTLQKDLGGGKGRAVADLSAIAQALYCAGNLDEWVKPEPVGLREATGNTKAYVLHSPKGVVLNISPWNFPFVLTVDPLINILAAGNCCVIKPSEVSRHSAELMAELFPKYLDTSAVKVVLGGVPETTALLKQKFDHIMYTGNSFVARIVMKAASEHLTPCTLELGGKCPTYVHESADLDIAVPRIAGVKFYNAGQICMAPDYICVDKSIAKKFKKKLVEEVAKYKDLPFGRFINERHIERVEKLVKSANGKFIMGNKTKVTQPTIIDAPNLEDSIMKEEIFGPVLPIHEVSGFKDAVEMIEKVCETPLAVYVFANTETKEGRESVDNFINSTRSGGVCVNSALEHALADNLAFGGFGESGMGSYRGFPGFKEFSHQRSVLEKDIVENKLPTIPIPHEAYEPIFNQLKAAGAAFGM
eukprot:snap_masked-scaffold_47-processed-gene-1.50-mRNA-1 protein AED:0.29 eAED:0.29 QI:0/0/0/1/1/1/3/0/481